MTGKRKVSDATKHSKDCHEQFNWLEPKTLAKLNNIHEPKIRKSLKLNNLETKAEYHESVKEIEVIQITRIHGSPCFIGLTWNVMLML